MNNYQPKVLVAVTSDIVTDQRAHKICNTLEELNFEVTLVGRKEKNSLPLPSRNYLIKRWQLLFNKGPLFYANYNIRLFFHLIFNNYDVIWSNDLDTLLSCYLAAKCKGKALIFDSHEYFTELPELVNRPKIKCFWKSIEKRILPKLKNVITVSEGIAQLYREEYNIDVKVVRNVPYFKEKKLSKVPLKKTIIYQGAINVNRGIETMVKSMNYIDDATLLIVGNGDVFNEIKQLINQLQLNDRVKMLGEVSFEELHQYTQQAILGLSLEEDMGLNYRLALPNKLFDYIHAEIPVLVSNLPEMSQLVKKYQVGEVAESHHPERIAEQIKSMLNNPQLLQFWKNNTKVAKQELNWDNEKKVIIEMIKNLPTN